MVFLPLMLIWLRDPMYFNAPSRWAMVALAASIGLLTPDVTCEKNGNIAAASDFSRSSPAKRDSPSPPAASSVVREGTRLTNRVGQFNQSDGGWYFTAAQDNSTINYAASSSKQDAPTEASSQSRSSRIRVLENLALQRVAQVIQQDPSDNRWIINAVITEFFGENRLLVVMAVRAPIDDHPQR